MSHDTAPETSEAPGTRRSFLKQSAAASALVVPGAMLANEAVAADKSSKKVATTSANSGLPNLYPGWNARNFQEIQADENFHVMAIQQLIMSLGGVVHAKPTFQGLRMPNVQAFAATAATFENVGARTYLGALPLLFDRTRVIPDAGAIALVEAYHSGWLNTLINAPIVPFVSPLVQPEMPSQTFLRVLPYIANLNGDVPNVTMTPSPVNDLAILNFALLLEYLESEFYNINVPVFFH